MRTRINIFDMNSNEWGGILRSLARRDSIAICLSILFDNLAAKYILWHQSQNGDFDNLWSALVTNQTLSSLSRVHAVVLLLIGHDGLSVPAYNKNTVT